MQTDTTKNIKILKRYGSSNNLVDNFNYSYYISTNKVQSVTGGTQYTYDLNGNLTSDTRDENDKKLNMIYDHRNLLIQFRNVRATGGLGGNEIYEIKYNYDESGGRIRKTIWLYQGELPDPVFEDMNPIGWQVVKDEFYVRDVSGKEIAIYDATNSTNLHQWNVYGLDNVGYIKSDGSKYFYLKDHLGSVRCVIDESNNVVSAQDYDCWGYLLENRSYESSLTKYKFTGKERDSESMYDYFGARYYDSRIGRWGAVEPLMEKYFSYSPYNYSVLNPIIFRDINGKDAIAEIDYENKIINIKIYLNYSIYSETNREGLYENQIEFLQNLKYEVEELWSGKVEINGFDYTFNINVLLKEHSTFYEALKYTDSYSGHNFVKNASVEDITESDLGIGVFGFGLFINKEFKTRKYTESHETGHLLGLPDLGYENRSVMGWHTERMSPVSSDRQEVLQRANLDLSITGPQKIGGFR